MRSPSVQISIFPDNPIHCPWTWKPPKFRKWVALTMKIANSQSIFSLNTWHRDQKGSTKNKIATPKSTERMTIGKNTGWKWSRKAPKNFERGICRLFLGTGTENRKKKRPPEKSSAAFFSECEKKLWADILRKVRYVSQLEILEVAKIFRAFFYSGLEYLWRFCVEYFTAKIVFCFGNIWLPWMWRFSGRKGRL